MAPSLYVQGPGALHALGPVLADLGEQALVIADTAVLRLLGERVDMLLTEHRLRITFRELTGEVTVDAADALAAPGADLDTAAIDVVVGLGGGKSLDAAKAVALRLDRPVVTVPTIASNDSPTSSGAAMYDERHNMVGAELLRQNPAAVIVDTELVAAAPASFLRAGIGDAIAKKWEALGCLHGTGMTPSGTRPLLTGIAIAESCYATIRRDAVAGLRACEEGRVTAELENLVEAVVLMSGLGFENGGLSLAHSLTRGLMPARGASIASHGEHVAWALLVQREAEGADESELLDLTRFLQTIGLPTNLDDLGMHAPTAGEIQEIARLTMTAPHLANLAQPVSETEIVAAISRVQARAAPGPDAVGTQSSSAIGP